MKKTNIGSDEALVWRWQRKLVVVVEVEPSKKKKRKRGGVGEKSRDTTA